MGVKCAIPIAIGETHKTACTGSVTLIQRFGITIQQIEANAHISLLGPLKLSSAMLMYPYTLRLLSSVLRALEEKSERSSSVKLKVVNRY